MTITSTTARTVVGLSAGLFAAPRLFEPLFRDQALFRLLGLGIWEGRWPYLDVFEHKPPGLLALYALAPPATLDVLSLVAAAVLLCVWLERRVGVTAAAAAGVAYAVAARMPAWGGFLATAQPEALQDAWLMGALVLLDRGRPAVAGACALMVLGLKFTYGLVLVPLVLLGRGRFVAGFLGAVAAAIVVAALSGTLVPAWECVVVFNLQHAGVSALPWNHVPEALVGDLARWARWAPALVLAVGGRDRTLGLILLAALAQLVMQRKLWAWHALPLVLPLVGLAAVAVRRRWWLLLVGVVPALGQGLWHAQRPFVDPVYAWSDFDASETRAVGDAVARHARPGDRLLVWGFEPGVYLYSGLPPAGRWLYDYPVSEGVFQDDALPNGAELLVVWSNDANALEPQPSSVQVRAQPWFPGGYDAVDAVGDAVIFRARSAGAPPR